MASTPDIRGFHFPGGSELLVGFPDTASYEPTSSVQPTDRPGRTSQAGGSRVMKRCSLAPAAMRTALVGLDSDDGDEDGETKPSNNNPLASGGPGHRPLVGGFAAAAYEAAREAHYRKQNIQVNTKKEIITRRPLSQSYRGNFGAQSNGKGQNFSRHPGQA